MAEKLGEILIRKGKITPAQLGEALRTQQFFGGCLGSHLINLGYLEEATLGSVLSDIHGVPFAPWERLRAVRLEVLRCLDPALSVRFTALPLDVDGDLLHVAILNPRDERALSEIADATGFEIVPHVSPEFRLIQAIERHYRRRPLAKRGIVVRAGETAPGDSTPRTQPPPAGPPDDEAPILGAEDELDLSLEPLGENGVPHGEAAAEPGVPAEEWTVPRSLRHWRDPAEFVEPHRPPTTIEQAAGQVASASSRETVCRPIVQLLARSFSRAAMLALLPDQVRILDAAGEGLADRPLRDFVIHRGQASFFDALRDGRGFHIGAVPMQPGTAAFFAVLGPHVPPSVLAVPVLVRERTIAALYADNLSSEIGAPDMDLLKRLRHLAALGLEIELLRKRLRSV